MPKSNQASLFDTYESANVSVSSSNTPIHIKISDKDDTEMLKLKKAFNKGLSQIEKIRRELEAFDINMQKLSDRYHTEIDPMMMELHKVQIQAIEILDAAYQKKSYTLTEKEVLHEHILKEINHLVDAGGTVPEKFNSYLAIPDEAKGLLADMVKEKYGFDVDPDDLAGETKLNFEDFQAKYQKFFIQDEDQDDKKMDTEFVDLREHFMKMYKSLAKRIHPDLERNETVRLQKEQLMQELTAAKENEDLFALLTLRQKIDRIEKTESDLDENFLALYLKKIKSELKALDNKLLNKKHSSGKDSFLYNRYYAKSEKVQSKNFVMHQLQLKDEIDEYEDWVLSFKTVKSTKEYIQAYLDEQLYGGSAYAFSEW
jgi:hypothetical protein